MSKIVIGLTLLLVLTSVKANLSFSSFNGDFSSYDPASTGIALSDLITVANHYGCKTWLQGQCTECSQGWYFNKNGVCCEVPSLCSQFNRAEGICQSCYQGYTIVDNCCKLAAQDLGCAEWNGNVCTRCSKRWWQDASGMCQPIGDQCSTWNNQNGQCLTCYGGYILSNGMCVINQNPFNGGSNALCGMWEGETCINCAKRSYFNSFGICTSVSDQCQTFDPMDGLCLSCYAGYTLNNGICAESAVALPTDVGCKTWNSAQDTCLECSNRFFFDGSMCMPVSDLCSTWDLTGQCTACYDGYDLVMGACQLSSTNTMSPTDSGCATWDWKAQRCLACSKNWVFNNMGVCTPVSDHCMTFDRAGNCQTCFDGYSVIMGKCELKPIEKPSDLGCGTWDWKNKRCIACSDNWVFNNMGVCVPVSDQCNTFDRSGACVSCYDGYNLNMGRCELAPIEKPSDLGCGTWDWKNKRCIACSDNWVKNNNGVCVPVSDQCKTFDLSGACVTCYDGYNLNMGKCELAPIEKPSDLGCGTWDWKNKRCIACSDNFVKNNNGVCVAVSDQCKTFDPSGACVTCYKGYRVVFGKCEVAPIEKPSDLGCALWNWDNKNCLKCSKNWVFNNNGVCTPVSDQCMTFNPSGACSSCYDGYRLNNGVCELAPIQKPSDLGCGTWDWKAQKCIACSNNWVFNNMGVCIPVSDQCNTFDRSGACITCYKGYNLNMGKCELAPIEKVSDLGCATWDWDNKRCIACSKRFVFNTARKCVPVSDNCRTWDASGACTDCYAGYLLQGGSCSQTNSLCDQSDANGACTTCYTGYILDNGSCVPISKLASLALFYSQCCPEKLATLTNQVGGAGAGSHTQFHA